MAHPLTSLMGVKQSDDLLATLIYWIDYGLGYAWKFSLRFIGWLFDPYLNIIEKYEYAAAFIEANLLTINWTLSYGLSVFAIYFSLQTIVMYLAFDKIFLDFGTDNREPEEPDEEIDPNTGLPIEPPVEDTDPSQII